MANGGLSPLSGEVTPELDGATPWFAPWWPWIAPAWAHWQLHGEVAAALNALPSRAPDFFNGCCWHRFPQTKLRLNQLQGEEIQRIGVHATRGPVRDALTLFDENVALLQAPDVLWQALQDRDWHQVFVTLRPQWQEVRWVVFGHALLEKLVQPYKSITAHVYRVAPEVAAGDHALDAWLAATLTPQHLATKPYQPLPVMGIPGWCIANEDPLYYADREVFRPRR